MPVSGYVLKSCSVLHIPSMYNLRCSPFQQLPCGVWKRESCRQRVVYRPCMQLRAGSSNSRLQTLAGRIRRVIPTARLFQL